MRVTKSIISVDNLRARVGRLLDKKVVSRGSVAQVSMGFGASLVDSSMFLPYDSVSDFLSFLSDLNPNGEMYLFGGLIRDVALYGKRGFASDIDVVIDGDWDVISDYLSGRGAKRNRFGGFRFVFDGWPIDVWSAEETWAIKHGCIEYRGISSLTDTTILNWDSILMNWRTKNFIHPKTYFPQLVKRHLELVLEENPNPLGMAVRVFRHLCSKDASKVGPKALNYLCRISQSYSLESLQSHELISYGSTLIEPSIYTLFRRFSDEGGDLSARLQRVGQGMEEEGWVLSSSQLALGFNDARK